MTAVRTNKRLVQARDRNLQRIRDLKEKKKKDGGIMVLGKAAENKVDLPNPEV